MTNDQLIGLLAIALSEQGTSLDVFLLELCKMVEENQIQRRPDLRKAVNKLILAIRNHENSSVLAGTHLIHQKKNYKEAELELC